MIDLDVSPAAGSTEEHLEVSKKKVGRQRFLTTRALQPSTYLHGEDEFLWLFFFVTLLMVICLIFLLVLYLVSNCDSSFFDRIRLNHYKYHLQLPNQLLSAIAHMENDNIFGTRWIYVISE
jgi:hypothetical protein